jgi:hypothetical protein
MEIDYILPADNYVPIIGAGGKVKDGRLGPLSAG